MYARPPLPWEVRKLKQVARIRSSNVDKKSEPDETPVRLCNYTDVYYNESITNDLPLMEATASSEEIQRFGLRRGDVLLTKDSETWYDIGVPAYVAEPIDKGVCGYHLAHLRPRATVVDGAFLARALSARGVREQFHLGANGITRYGLTLNDMGEVLVPIPPLPTQRAIAAFLDHETAKIDALIEKKRRLLDLLEEKRTALITRAVTRGLDPDVPTKDSGVEWLGEIPAHWDVARLRRIARVVDCKHRTPQYVPSGYPLVSTTEVKPGTLDLSECTRFVTRPDYLDMTEGRRHPEIGDIIYSRNASFGAAALVDTDTPFCMGQDVVLVRGVPDLVDTTFLNLQLNSPVVTKQVEALGIGSTFSRINVADIRDLLVTVPPLAEQNQIARRLSSRTEQSDRLT